MLAVLPGQTIPLAEWQVAAAYAVFAVSYLVFALGKLSGMKIDRVPGELERTRLAGMGALTEVPGRKIANKFSATVPMPRETGA